MAAKRRGALPLCVRRHISIVRQPRSEGDQRLVNFPSTTTLTGVQTGRRVLVVDDDDGVRTAVTWALEADGFEVIAVENGLAAIDAIESSTLSLVVLDLSLPGLGGLDILNRVRTTEAREGSWRLPIIVLSGRDREMDRIVGLDLGADDYLVKPFSPGELAARARSLLRLTEPRSGRQPFEPTGSGVEIDASHATSGWLGHRSNLRPRSSTSSRISWTIHDAHVVVRSCSLQSGQANRAGRTRRPSLNTCTACVSKSRLIRGTPSGYALSVPSGTDGKGERALWRRSHRRAGSPDRGHGRDRLRRISVGGTRFRGLRSRGADARKPMLSFTARRLSNATTRLGADASRGVFRGDRRAGTRAVRWFLWDGGSFRRTRDCCRRYDRPQVGAVPRARGRSLLASLLVEPDPMPVACRRNLCRLSPNAIRTRPTRRRTGASIHPPRVACRRACPSGN